MIGYNKVFLDTAPLIYFLDDDKNYGERSRLILEEIITGSSSFCSDNRKHNMIYTRSILDFASGVLFS